MSNHSGAHSSKKIDFGLVDVVQTRSLSLSLSYFVGNGAG